METNLPIGKLETADIQGIILSGYGHLGFSSYLFLRIRDAAKAKGWLKSMAAEVTNGTKPDHASKSKPNLNVAISAAGVKALGLPDAAFKTFSLEFQQGMAEEERARILGDTGESAPDKWALGGPAKPEIHILLMLFAATDAGRSEFREKQRARFAAAGLEEIDCENSFRTEENKEPFGFRDGISQPGLKELGGEGDLIGAGEFIMGYPNEYLKMPFTPTVASALDKQGLLPADATDKNSKDLGKNGTYLVFRKLLQDVEGFHAFMREHSKGPDGRVDEKHAEWLAAKCVGRWPSGAPLTLSPDKDDPKLGADPHRNNDFAFAATDLKGYGCPMGAHIRRSNPRDSLIPNPIESVKMVSRHRILRRGRVFEDKTGKGLHFICLNANIRRQFEFIQQTWINDRKFDGGYDTKDPVTANADGKGFMVIPMEPVRKRVPGMLRFVQVLGGEYFFLPGIRALQFLGNL